MKEIILRPYQLDSIEALRENIRQNIINQILVAPTGAGKTVLAAHLIDECHKKGRRALFVADRISLINQTSETLDEYGIPHGVIQANHWRTRPYERIQVASALTLAKRRWPEVDLIIVDEAHSLMKTVTDRIAKRNVRVIGLTATPFSRGLGKHYDAVVSVTTTNKLIDDKFLVPFRIFAASAPDMEGAKTTAGEWSDSEAADRSMPIVGDCVAEYMRHAKGKKFIAFGCTIAHCEELQRQFMDAGVVTELYTCNTPDEARTEMVKEFRKPDSYIRGLVSVSALAKGFDVSDVEVIIMARPLRSSLAEHIQILGRGLRIHEGKEECIVLDHSGNCIRFWQEMHEFFDRGAHVLDDGKRKKKEPARKKDKKPVKCPKCHAVHDARPTCPSCGHVYERASGIKHLQGNLDEIGGSTGDVPRDERQSLYSELLWIAEERGYKQGWAYYKFMDRFGIKPFGLDPTPVPASKKTRDWLLNLVIAASRSRAKAEARA